MYKKKRSASSVIFLIIIFSLLAGALYLYNSAMFERDKPSINVKSKIYWNLKEPIKVTLNDASGIKYYTVVLKTATEEYVLKREVLHNPLTHIDLDITFAKARTLLKEKSAVLKIHANDASRWNLFSGNNASAEATIIIDKKRPTLSVVTNSYGIRRGGSALVIAKVKDENLDEFYIDNGAGKHFKLQPFYKEDYFIALVAWPVNSKKFRATLIANDFAGNRARTPINFRLKEKKYRLSHLKLKSSFIDGKITQLAQEHNSEDIEDGIERFKYVNETLRNDNEKLIHDIASKISDERIDNFKLEPFYPLKNAAAVASFGDHRKYSYQKNEVSQSYHLGLDLASVKMAPIVTQNDAKVIYASENGIYGSMLMLDFGLGLTTVYGHCTNILVDVDSFVSKGTQIANTGMTGLALGDHLHFGTLVQGVEVRPEEWMDKQWFRLNVSNVIKDAKKIIIRQ